MGAGGGYAEAQNPLRGHDFHGHRRMRAHGWPPTTESYPVGNSYVTRVDGRRVPNLGYAYLCSY